MSKLVQIELEGMCYYINTSHIVFIESYNIEGNEHFKLYLSDGRVLEFQGKSDLVVSHCNNS